jgi:hypothetical protein
VLTFLRGCSSSCCCCFCCTGSGSIACCCCLDSAECVVLAAPAMQCWPSSVGLMHWLTALSRLLKELLWDKGTCKPLLLPQLLALLLVLSLALMGCRAGRSLGLGPKLAPVCCAGGLTCCCFSASGLCSAMSFCLKTLLLRRDCRESLIENVLFNNGPTAGRSSTDKEAL